MKKLLLILSLLASLGLEAQNEGIYYYLPRTVIKLEVTLEETQYHIGPYAEFASELLGTNDYIKENKTVIRLKSVDIQSGSEPDPNASYFVDIDEKSKESVQNIILDNDGIIQAIGYSTLQEGFAIEKTPIEYEMEIKPETTVSFIEIIEDQEDKDEDDEEEGRKATKKSPKRDKALSAIDKISKLRTAYYDLISGVNETNYGNTISYMAENMERLENEYISLFKGKKTTTTYKKYIYLKPNNNDANASISCEKLENGEVLKVQFETKNINDTPTTEATNKLSYRIPAQTTVTITSGKNVLASKTLIISQFGVLKQISTKNNKIIFNPNTGQIISISK